MCSRASQSGHTAYRGRNSSTNQVVEQRAEDERRHVDLDKEDHHGPHDLDLIVGHFPCMIRVCTGLGM